jgi:hypothetical protein
MGERERRSWAGGSMLLGLVLIAAACSDPAVLQATTTAPPATGSMPAATTQVAAAAPTPPPPGVVTAQGVIQLPRIEPMSGSAPARLADPEYPAVYLDYPPDPGDLGDPLPPPASVAVQLVGCRLIGPGVAVWEIDVQGDDSDFPFESGVLAQLAAGDIGSGAAGRATFASPGRQLVVGSRHDQMRAVLDAGREAWWLDDADTYASRYLDWGEPGDGCQLELGFDDQVATGWLDLEAGPEPLEITAPPGSVEELAQASFGNAVEGGDLHPIALTYGEVLQFFAERWFLPAEPGRLDTIAEDLHPDGCLEVEFTWDTYTVLQQRGCVLPDAEPVYLAGDSWVATATDGEWVVKVAAPDRALAEEVAASLQPHWHLLHRDIPLAPVDEREVGRAAFQGGEVLVTIGEQRCTDPCFSPEQWFYVYRITDSGLLEYAHYPAWSGCILVEEEPFTMAVAPRFGSIEIVGDDESSAVTGGETEPFAFIETDGSRVEDTIAAEDGGAPPCIEQRADDDRGGIEPFPLEPELAATTTSRRIAMTACATAPDELRELTDGPPLRQACTRGPDGLLTAAWVISNRMLVDPPDGRECLLVFDGSGTSATCVEPDGSFEPVRSSDDRTALFAMMVPEGTTRVVGTTSRGTRVVGIPHDGLVVLWWSVTNGELRRVVATTPDGPILLSEL